MIAMAMLLAAAAPGETIVNEDDLKQMAMVAKGREADAVGQANMLKGKGLNEALSGAVSGRTRAVLIKDYGIYVVYNAPDGRLHAWFPGRAAPVGGTWGVQKFSSKVIVACQRFDRPDQPRTGPYLPKECVPAERTLGGLDVMREWQGDVFALASGRVPYVKQAMGLPTP